MKEKIREANTQSPIPLAPIFNLNHRLLEKFAFCDNFATDSYKKMPLLQNINNMNNYFTKMKTGHLHNTHSCKGNGAKGGNACTVEKGKISDTNSSIIWQNFSSTYHRILKS